jgi:hypothetical protein
VDQPAASELETDPRFPSGPWTGYYIQPLLRGKFRMELRLRFRLGEMDGEGRDPVGAFLISGRYTLDSGQCHWTKRYVGKHDVYYKGFNEGKGIWGVWELTDPSLPQKGGFHIWPEGMPDPTGTTLTEAADLPVSEPVRQKAEEELLVPASAQARPAGLVAPAGLAAPAGGRRMS